MSACKFVQKNDGSLEAFEQEKLSALMRNLCRGLDPTFVKPDEVVERICQGLPATVHETSLSNLMAETPAYMSQLHPDYGRLAARVAITWLRKSTPATFSACVQILAENIC